MAKRGNNEGSIYHRKDGRWVAVLDLGWTAGTRRRRSYYAKTRQEVAQKLTASLRAHQEGLPVAADRQSLSQFLERWLTDSVKTTVRVRTYRSYAELVRLHIKPELGRIPLSKLNPQDVQAFVNRKLDSGLSPRTVQYMHAVLRRALGQAERWGVVPRNVARLVSPPRVALSKTEPLTPDEARRLLDTVRGERLEALYTVAIAVGLRQGEALGLHWSDIDLDGGTLAVRHALQWLDGEPSFVEPKTDRGRRTITLPSVTLTALRTHRVRQAEERLRVGPHWRETGLVFTTQTGGPLEPHAVTRQFQRRLAKAGIGHHRFHDLRHTCATLLLAQGVSLRVVMETLGHTQIATTADIYSHVLPALMDEAARKMNDALATNALSERAR